jgi:hypothetical protein
MKICKECKKQADLEVSTCDKTTYEKKEVFNYFCESCYDNKYTVMPFPNLTRYLDDGLVDCNLFDWR